MRNDPSPLLLRLIDEHRVFTVECDRLLGEARASPAGGLEIYETLQRLCSHFLEEFHHGKEETLLFSDLVSNPRLCEGGPECVLHFDERMRRPPLAEALDACRATGWTDASAAWVDVPDFLRVTSSPISIPMEDHEAGRVLLRGIQRLLPQGLEAVAMIDGLFERYRELQLRHFRREEGCLFRLCHALIPPARWRELEAREPKWSGPACGGSVSARAPSDDRS